MKFANHLSKKDIQKVNQLRRANTKKDNPKLKRIAKVSPKENNSL